MEAKIERITKLSFVDAINLYVIKPLGLEGHFDLETEYPPFTARGFVGSNEDLMIIGSTLASKGISPKTRLQVLSQQSINTMLRDWTQEFKDSFSLDKTVASMNRFYHEKSEFQYEVVNGYGLGLWHVKGWRTKKGQ